MARPVARWNGAGKYLSGIVVLCFFLPFFGISCDGVDVLHFSGVDMAAGCAPGGMLVDAASEAGSEKHHGGSMTGGAMGGAQLEGKMDSVDREPLAIVALASALVVFGAAFQKKKGARAMALAFALISVAALGGLYVMETGKLTDSINEKKKPSGKKDIGEEIGKEMTKDTKVEAGSRFGFWVVAFGMLTLAGLAGAAVKQGEDPPEPITTAPPPQAPPPMA
jgi:hypothetical protein